MFRVLYYSLGIGLPVLLVLVFAGVIFQNFEPMALIGTVSMVLSGSILIIGLMVGILVFCRVVTLACPQCGARKTRVGGDPEAGVWIECTDCGTTEGRGFFKRHLRLNSNSCNPTREWGGFSAWQNPLVVPDEMRVGDFAFGDRIETFELLGRADGFEWTGLNLFHLDYWRGGFQLDFDEEQLSYIGFILDPSACEEELGENQWAAASPQVQLEGGECRALSRETSMSDLMAMFGSPTRIDKDSEETILFYEKNRLMMEFELKAEAHTLVRWNLFPRKVFFGDESDRVAV